jgi:signal transduction histidine kinase/CheY-like chemotaxis protein
MADSLRESHQTLEQRVVERTAALEAEVVERKRTEVELQSAKEAAESASRAKSAFLATMSHEIRTPMNAVLGMTSLLAESPLTAEQREYTRIIRAGGGTLLALINDVLDFSKIEAGELSLDRHTFVLTDCIEEVLEMLAVRAGEKGLELTYLIDADVPAVVRSDAIRLRQILLNLISNGIKFTDQGEVSVHVKAESRKPKAETKAATAESAVTRSDSTSSDIGFGISDLPDQVTLQFEVHDTGSGIAADQLDRLFRPFSQVDSSLTRRHGGTGLGLAISKRLCEAMGGTMSLESVLGRGSTFRFSITVEALPMPPAEITGPLQGKRVLIVDDNATNRRQLCSLVEAWGMTAAAAAGGEAALEQFREGALFDAAILDLNMPGMDGPALARALHEFSMTRALPLIGLGALGQSENGEERSQFAVIVTKPVQWSRLQRALVDVIAPEARSAAAAPAASTFDSSLADRVPLRILLAEDVLVNQKLMLAILNRLGYQADVAVNGLEVLAALKRELYDLILMDVQMPEMDGLEATRRIRVEVPDDRQPRIIALTANAMKEDRAICLSAGMDDYLSKPIDLGQLHGALIRCAAPSAAPVPVARRSTGDGAFDESILAELRLLQDNARPHFLMDMLSAFRTDSQRHLEGMRAAAAAGDAEQWRSAAHSLKGAAGCLGARQLAQLCQEAEQRGRTGLLANIEELLTRIENQLSRDCVALDSWAGELVPEVGTVS